MPNKKIAVYARVSSSSQSLDAQLAELEAHVNAYYAGYDVKWFKDVATGNTMTRPAMEEMMALILGETIDCVIVWRIDRLGRTISGLTGFFNELSSRQVKLVSLKEGNLDLSTSAGRFMVNVLASVASYENEVRKERQLAGIAAAKAKGKQWGGSAKGRRYKVTDDHCEVVKRMYEDGKKIAVIARITKLSRPTIYKLLGAGKKLPSEPIDSSQDSSE